MTLHAINVDGVAYRSFRLISVNHQKWTENNSIKKHCAVNKKRKANSKYTHLGPHRAAQKLFDSWCRTNNIQSIDKTRFVIQETTRGKKHKTFVYDGERIHLTVPRIVKVLNKKNNKTYTIEYAYQSKVKAYKKKNNQDEINKQSMSSPSPETTISS